MPYNMWFLTPASHCSPAKEWTDFVREMSADDDEPQKAKLTAGKPKDWRQISVTYPDGSWSFDFERYTVGASGEWGEDLSDFREGLGVEPSVNAQWLYQYLARVQTVYMFRCSTSAPDSNLEMVREIVDSLRHDDENVGGHSGLLYAEREGWSNEDGQHLTWEFSDRVTGMWWMALRRDDGWDVFQMDLGNRDHRTAFKAGKVPTGVESRLYRD